MRIPVAISTLTLIAAVALTSAARAQYAGDCAQAGADLHRRDSLLNRAWSAFEGESRGLLYEMRVLRQAIEAGPPPEERWVIFTQVFSAWNRPDSALSLMHEAVARWPQCVPLWVARARMFGTYHRDSLAIAAAEQATQQFSEDPYVWGATSLIVGRAGNPALGATHLRHALSIDDQLLRKYPAFRETYDDFVRLNLLPPRPTD